MNVFNIKYVDGKKKKQASKDHYDVCCVVDVHILLRFVFDLGNGYTEKCDIVAPRCVRYVDADDVIAITLLIKQKTLERCSVTSLGLCCLRWARALCASDG